jgi:hypothetical protein
MVDMNYFLFCLFFVFPCLIFSMQVERGQKCILIVDDEPGINDKASFFRKRQINPSFASC